MLTTPKAIGFGQIHKKFLPEYGLNFVNLVDRPTIDVTELKKGEEQAGIGRTLFQLPDEHA